MNAKRTPSLVVDGIRAGQDLQVGWPSPALAARAPTAAAASTTAWSDVFDGNFAPMRWSKRRHQSIRACRLLQRLRRPGNIGGQIFSQLRAAGATSRRAKQFTGSGLGGAECLRPRRAIVCAASHPGGREAERRRRGMAHGAGQLPGLFSDGLRSAFQAMARSNALRPSHPERSSATHERRRQEAASSTRTLGGLAFGSGINSQPTSTLVHLAGVNGPRRAEIRVANIGFQ